MLLLDGALINCHHLTATIMLKHCQSKYNDSSRTRLCSAHCTMAAPELGQTRMWPKLNSSPIYCRPYRSGWTQNYVIFTNSVYSQSSISSKQLQNLSNWRLLQHVIESSLEKVPFKAICTLRKLFKVKESNCWWIWPYWRSVSIKIRGEVGSVQRWPLVPFISVFLPNM